MHRDGNHKELIDFA